MHPRVLMLAPWKGCDFCLEATRSGASEANALHGRLSAGRAIRETDSSQGNELTVFQVGARWPNTRFSYAMEEGVVVGVAKKWRVTRMREKRQVTGISLSGSEGWA